MRERVTLLVFAAGLCLAITGTWWVWTGLEIVLNERGWSSVIAGATMLSAGFVVMALAAVLRKLQGIVEQLRQPAATPAATPTATAIRTTDVAPPKDILLAGAMGEPQGVVEGADPRAQERSTPVSRRPKIGAIGSGSRSRPPAPMAPQDDSRETPGSHGRDDAATIPEPPSVAALPPDGRDTIGRHMSGDTTYIMFADGTVEAHTPDGVVTFPSLDALRAHAEEREAAGAGEIRSSLQP